MLGEEIAYRVTATNDGNLTLTDVKVADELTGDTWTIASLLPGASKTFTASHVVTEADIQAGKVVNVATATGTSPDPDQPKPTVVPGTDEEPTQQPVVEPDAPSTPAPGEFTGSDLDDTVYNGTEQKQPVTITDKETGEPLVEGVDYIVTYSDDVTNVGEVTVTVTGIGDYEGEELVLTYNITPATVTVTADDITKVIGTEDTPLTATVEGLIGDDTIDYTITRVSGEDAGTYTITPAGDATQGNYNVIYVPGTFTINATPDAPLSVTVTANSDVFGYDGTAHSVSGFVTTEFTIDGKTYTVSGLTATTTATNAGDYPVNVTGTPVVRDAEGNDVTSRFAVNTVAGTLHIVKRSIFVVSGSSTKVYDGSPLTNDEITYGFDSWYDGSGQLAPLSLQDQSTQEEGFVLDDESHFNVVLTGSQTEVGTSDNTFTYSFDDPSVENNYIVTARFGTLTVTDAAAGGTEIADDDTPTSAPETQIDDEDTPKSAADVEIGDDDTPLGASDTEIEDSDTPLAASDDGDSGLDDGDSDDGNTTEIDDEDTPLASGDTVQTGDELPIAPMSGLILSLMAAFIALSTRRRYDKEAEQTPVMRE